MTEEYKKNLIDYITNNLKETSPTNEEIFLEELEINRSEWADYLPPRWTGFRYEGMITANENTSNLSILYGGYIVNGEVKGIITLVDENFKPVKTFYQFDSGTDLRYIQCMKQDEDGKFYYIDDEAFSYTKKQQVITSQKRFVMINNLTIKSTSSNDYVLKYRKSYIIPSEYTNFYCYNMFKDPNSSHYIFFGDGADADRNYDYTKLTIFDLKINVGETNEWTAYVNQQERSLFGCSYVLFNSNSDVYFRCVYTYTATSSRSIYCITKTYTGSPETSVISTFEYSPYIDAERQKNQSLFFTIDKLYYVQNNQQWGSPGVAAPKYIGLYEYDFSTNIQKTIYEKYLGDYDYTYKELINIDKNETDLYIQYVNNWDIENHTADYYFQRYEGTWNPKLGKGNANFYSNTRAFFVKNSYNLLQIYSYSVNPANTGWFTYEIKEVYNPTQYNGEPYTSVDSLVPEYANLYSNNELVFSRNLYNVTKQSNSTMSSVEVPYNYLNDLDIIQNDLISKTNQELINDYTNWNKNIYEIVDVNFLNTINVIDEDTQTPYLNSAIKVNNAITDGGNTNYQNTPCTKYRLNYSDNTSSIGNITWDDINDLVKQTTISFSPVKEVKSIDLISNDESTIYMKINETFETGKLYTITQKVRIGDKPTKKEVHYRGENVCYNNNKIEVYSN